MKTLYLDNFSGISGDMFLGAMLDLGLDLDHLKAQLALLGLEGYHLHISRQQRGAIAGTKFDVHVDGHGPHHEHEHHHGHAHPHDEHEHEHEHDHEHGHEHEHGHGHEHGRTYAQIREMIRASDLSAWVKEKAVAVFHRVALAEGRIHGQPPEKVHFHEVGAVDSIVDIVGACIALEMLGRPRVLAGPVVEGTGMIHCAHGQFPLPAPATLEILRERGVALSQCEEPHELVTPTGAALLAEFAESFGRMPELQPEKIGFGLGGRENHTRPNVLRAILGVAQDGDVHDWETDTVAVLETNVDDMPAEVLGHLVHEALAAGALDVFHTPVQMKKNRPGTMLTLLCPAPEADRLTAWLLTHTTTFGVRRHLCERRKLRREMIEVQTPHGPVAVKVGRLNGGVVQVSPEYESCRELATRAGVPLRTVYDWARRAAETT